MPRLTEEQRREALIVLTTGVFTFAQVAEQFGVNPSSITRMWQKHQYTLGIVPPPRRPVPPAATPINRVDLIAEGRSIAVERCAERFMTLTSKALDRLDDALDKDAVINPLQVEIAQAIIDKFASSADARIGAESAVVQSEAFAEAIGKAFYLTPEEEVERRTIRETMIDVVEERKPLIVNEKDIVS